jgi:5'-nucleotidase
LVPFLERIKTPIVSCNIDASQEPVFEKLFTKSIVIERGGREIGIIGVTTTFESFWGKAIILPEVEFVRKEVDIMVAKGVKIIVVLSHAGLGVDREIAKGGGAIDIIVGGHSHSFLYSGEPVGPDTPVGDYPTIEKQDNGREVLIVQASAYAKYLGNITLYFDDDGEIKSYEGAPIFLSNDVEQDPEIVEKLKPWQAEIGALQNRQVGVIKHELDVYCFQRECGMGNLVTDSMAYAVS